MSSGNSSGCDGCIGCILLILLIYLGGKALLFLIAAVILFLNVLLGGAS